MSRVRVAFRDLFTRNIDVVIEDETRTLRMPRGQRLVPHGINIFMTGTCEADAKVVRALYVTSQQDPKTLEVLEMSVSRKDIARTPQWFRDILLQPELPTAVHDFVNRNRK